MYKYIDVDVQGMFTRVFYSGFPINEEKSAYDIRKHLSKNFDSLRLAAVNEPYGHSSFTSVILYRSRRSDSDFGLVYMDKTGFIPMCGHATFAAAAALSYTEFGFTEEQIIFDTPYENLKVTKKLLDNHSWKISIENISSKCYATSHQISVDSKLIDVDIANCGNTIASVKATDLNMNMRNITTDDIIKTALSLMKCINIQLAQDLAEMGIPEICHLYLVESELENSKAKSTMIVYPGWIDRSPCGSGTAAQAAIWSHKNLIAVGQKIQHYSYINSWFEANIKSIEKKDKYTCVLLSLYSNVHILGFGESFQIGSPQFPRGINIYSL